jgi:hypothetical protein
MRPTLSVFALVILGLLLGGCIVSDQLTTLTIYPDGSADLVIVCSNIRSTMEGADGAKELAKYKANFDAKDEADFTRIKDSGGTIVNTAWIRDEPPYSNFVRAHFPDSAALEKFGTMERPDGEALIATRFSEDGATRRLTIRITTRSDEESTESGPNVEQLRQNQADAIAETRIAVVDGSITDSRGFVVANDKQSALLDRAEIDNMLHAETGEAELFLQWEIDR